jgi:hypothetical protein
MPFPTLRPYSTISKRQRENELEKEQVTIDTTSTEVSQTDLQDDLDLSKPPPADKSKDPLGEQLTYSQEYYILHREELMEKRKQKEAARLP